MPKNQDKWHAILDLSVNDQVRVCFHNFEFALHFSNIDDIVKKAQNVYQTLL